MNRDVIDAEIVAAGAERVDTPGGPYWRGG